MSELKSTTPTPMTQDDASQAAPVSDAGSNEVRTFRGRSMEELIPRIRAELGPDAIVVRSREVLEGGVGGFFRRQAIEVEARLPLLHEQADSGLPRNDRATAEGLATEGVRALIEAAHPFAAQLEQAQRMASDRVADAAAVEAAADPVAPAPPAFEEDFTGADAGLYGPQPNLGAIAATLDAAARAAGDGVEELAASAPVAAEPALAVPTIAQPAPPAFPFELDVVPAPAGAQPAAAAAPAPRTAEAIAPAPVPAAAPAPVAQSSAPAPATPLLGVETPALAAEVTAARAEALAARLAAAAESSSSATSPGTSSAGTVFASAAEAALAPTTYEPIRRPAPSSAPVAQTSAPAQPQRDPESFASASAQPQHAAEPPAATQPKPVAEPVMPVPAPAAPQAVAPVPAIAPAALPPRRTEARIALNPFTSRSRDEDTGGDSYPAGGVAAERIECRLIDAGLPARLASGVVAEAVHHIAPLAPSVALEHHVRDALARRLPPARSLRPGRRTLAFVGSGGAGKSTLAANLAAAYARAGARVAAIALGGPAAGQALSARLEPLGIHVHTAASGAAAREIIERIDPLLAVVDVCLDTGARDDGAAELRRLGADEVHLALPAILSAPAAREAHARHRTFGVTHMALTHADATSSPGAPLGVAVETGLALSYACTRESATLVDPAAIAGRLLS